ncbi:mediator of RNA polymerase II transcription subunit 26 [Cylas formicarius]|uniref:mediator of RNA polymerase II transcription subunit 26 n=1 Tax=Cylas formicarius TaxID=197179 RepID=UPI0029586840|nr:mediator of RNA polymerase II transcription subunit 26 [Cylas formicarius]
MQNNVTELTQRLLGALDSNYNVIDMPEVFDIISLLDKVAITKELLQATRLGKHVNELRRKTTNELLSKRAKDLLKKWRSLVLPEANGQIKSSPPLQQPLTKVSPPLQQQISQRLANPCLGPKLSPNLQQQQIQNQIKMGLSPPLVDKEADVNLNQLKGKKRPIKEVLDTVNAKRGRYNGVTDLELSDNSNSSFKDVIPSSGVATPVKSEPKRDVIVINSDSNSSAPERGSEPPVDQQMPKKRGRKKGSKNHKNLIDEAESSFTNKLAVSASRGNSKVKTTQELLASIQNKNSTLNAASLKPKEDLVEKAAKLTERVSIIDQKLNTNASRSKNSQKGKFSLTGRNERVIESGSVINDKSLLAQANRDSGDEEIVVVDDVEPEEYSDVKSESQETEETPEREDSRVPRSLSVEEALSRLPPVDKSVLLDEDEADGPPCTCQLKENKPDFCVDEDEAAEQRPPFEVVEDPSCPAKTYLLDKYRLGDVSESKVHRLHTAHIPNVNGNEGGGGPKPEPAIVDGLYANVVPNIYERLDKENFRKYSVSESDSGSGVGRTGAGRFREWFECVELPSYDGDALRILPYCIVD